jgi:hypothetical protein
MQERCPDAHKVFASLERERERERKREREREIERERLRERDVIRKQCP